jgi:NAD(P)-dependent dehydrogenase (short-subunit alcohol dehydrogenase family)
MKNKKYEQVAIITGGASGIGYAIAKKFVNNRIRTVILGRNATRLKLACETLGERASFLVCDLDQLNELPGVVKKICELYGRVDILVNNAAIHIKKPMCEVTDEEYNSIVLTNQTAAFCLTREVARVMKEQGGGSILNISAIASRYGLPDYIAFTASKSAVEGMTRAMAVELGEAGIRVNCISPGFIRTNASNAALERDPDWKIKAISRTPLRRLGKPGEIADAALFLVSGHASYITGVILPVDGGNSIGF